MLSPDSLSTQSDPKSLEEKDHLERSTKKIKGNHPEQNIVEESSPMEADQCNTSQNHPPDVQMEPNLEGSTGDLQKNFTETKKLIEKARSFKAALLNAHSPPTEGDKPEISELDFDSEDEDMESEPVSTVSRIRVEFSKEHLKRIRQNHRGCVIIKLLGRNMGFKPLMDRISNLWDLEGLFTPIDLGLGFYLIRFESRADYNKVYTGGPWILQDHYLIVRKWQPQFKADMATAIKTAV